MANTGVKGVDIRQTGTAIVFRALETASGAALSTGTTTLSIIELQSDSTIKSYDFNDNTFKTTACTTFTANMTHRTANNATVDTGVWTYALSTLTGFTIGAVYFAIAKNSGGDSPHQVSQFQYGSVEGDVVTTSGATGVAYPQVTLASTVGINANLGNAANNLNISLGVTGLTITAAIVKAGTVTQTGISIPEISGRSGYYSGTMPAVAAGYYDVLFYGANSQLLGVGTINWNGTSELLAVAVAPTEASISTVVWGDLLSGSDFGTAGSIGEAIKTHNTNWSTTRSAKIDYLNAYIASIPTAVWQDLLAGSDFSTSSSIGKLLKDDIDAKISTAGGGASAASVATAVWQDLLAGADFSTVASIGKLIKDYLDAAISSRTKPADTQAAVTTATNLTNAPTAGDFTATMKASLNAATPASVTGAVGSVTGNVGGSVSSVTNPVILTSAYDPAKTAPPTTTDIANTLLVDGITNKLKVNTDHSVNSAGGGGGAIQNYITVPAAVAVASQDPAVITCLRGDSLQRSLPLMGSLTTRTKLVMTVKATTNDSDNVAVLQIVEGVGLMRLNGSPSVTAGTASLTVSDATTGAVDLRVDASVTSMFAVMDLVWDVQAYLSTGITTPISGVLSVVADVTQAVI